MKGHGLFQDLDWDMVVKKQYKPPFEPHVVNETDVQHFDEQFTSRSPRESNETPPNHKSDDPNISTKSKPVIDCSNMFEEFDYVSDIFNEDDFGNSSVHPHAQSKGLPMNSKSPKFKSNDIITDPVDDSDESISTWKNCLKCQLQINKKDNRSNSNSGDENKTVNELKELRICSHGS